MILTLRFGEATLISSSVNSTISISKFFSFCKAINQWGNFMLPSKISLNINGAKIETIETVMQYQIFVS